MKNSTLIALTVGGVVGFIGVVLLCVLMPLSVKKVEHDEYAIRYNKYTKKIDSKVYEQGRHVLDPGDKLFKFPRKFVPIDQTGGNAIICITRDGLDVVLDLTTQYQFPKENLHKVLAMYGEAEAAHTFLVTVTRDSIRDTCGNYTAESFFFQRGDIEAAMLLNLRGDFSVAETYANVGFLQLKNVNLPDRFEDAIKAKQLAIQDSEKALNERAQKLIEVDTLLKQEKENATIRVIQANANADGINLKAQEDASIILTLWQDRGDAFSSIKSGLGVNATEFVDGYLESFVLQSVVSPVVNLD